MGTVRKLYSKGYISSALEILKVEDNSLKCKVFPEKSGNDYITTDASPKLQHNCSHFTETFAAGLANHYNHLLINAAF